MNIRNLIQNRALQEQFVQNASKEELRAKVYEVLKFAEECIARLNNCPSEDDQVMQDFALRALFFFLNQFAEFRMKQADEVDEEIREKAIAEIKEDFELIVRFCDNPDQIKQYFFKCNSERVFEIITMAAVSFTGGNPGIERVEENAEQRRMLCFDIVMQGLHYHFTL